MSVKDFQRHQLLFTRALARSSELSCGPIAPRRNIPRGLGACLVAVGGRNRETCFSATQYIACLNAPRCHWVGNPVPVAMKYSALVGLGMVNYMYIV